MADYRLVTCWQLEAPLEEVYAGILHSLRWPYWWQGLESVDEIEPGDEDGIGSVRRYTWKSRFFYKISFAARTTRIEPLAMLEANVMGDLEGIGRWLFFHAEGLTTARHEWQVRTTRRWMNVLAPVARPLFEKNHQVLMHQGAVGLARMLRAPLTGVQHDRLPA